VYVYRQVAGNWVYLDEFTGDTLAVNAQFGKVLAMDKRGTRILVGAPGDGVTDTGDLHVGETPRSYLQSMFCE
jgi:hypothetical protein